jgi:hypothetical protein
VEKFIKAKAGKAIVGVTMRDAARSLGLDMDGALVPPVDTPEEPEDEPEEDEDVVPAEHAVGPEAFTLTWEMFQRLLRMTHALPYIYYQSKTVKGQRLLLMGTRSKHFTMRNLIMGLGRVQRSDMVMIAGKADEEMIMEEAEEAYKEALEGAPADGA